MLYVLCMFGRMDIFLKLLSKYTLKNIITQKYAECFRPRVHNADGMLPCLAKSQYVTNRFLIKGWHPHLPRKR